jgi:hypothetical protein
MWSNGKQHGEARFTNSKGRSKLGLWENGERVKWLNEGKSSIRDGMSSYGAGES